MSYFAIIRKINNQLQYLILLSDFKTVHLYI